jgi:tol-pal system protein YbgF
MKNPLQQIARNLALTGLVVLVGAGSASAQEKVEDRLTRIERLLNSGALTDMSNRQEQLRQSVQDLRGEVELLRRDMDEVKQRQHELYVDIDRRLRQLETTAQAPAAPAAEQPAQAPATQDAAAPAPIAPPGDELSDYTTAFNLLKSGRYAQAAQAFETFIDRHPKGQYIANGLYWLGESYYVVRDFAKAQPYFKRVLEDHPGSGKQPDAMLKIGFIHFEQGELDKARIILEKVKTTYPSSSAAALAQQRLLRMEQGSR